MHDFGLEAILLSKTMFTKRTPLSPVADSAESVIQDCRPSAFSQALLNPKHAKFHYFIGINLMTVNPKYTSAYFTVLYLLNLSSKLWCMIIFKQLYNCSAHQISPVLFQINISCSTYSQAIFRPKACKPNWYEYLSNYVYHTM